MIISNLQIVLWLVYVGIVNEDHFENLGWCEVTQFEESILVLWSILTKRSCCVWCSYTVSEYLEAEQRQMGVQRTLWRQPHAAPASKLSTNPRNIQRYHKDSRLLVDFDASGDTQTALVIFVFDCGLKVLENLPFLGYQGVYSTLHWSKKIRSRGSSRLLYIIIPCWICS